jgi:hypothetical protein
LEEGPGEALLYEVAEHAGYKDDVYEKVDSVLEENTVSEGFEKV